MFLQKGSALYIICFVFAIYIVLNGVFSKKVELIGKMDPDIEKPEERSATLDLRNTEKKLLDNIVDFANSIKSQLPNTEEGTIVDKDTIIENIFFYHHRFNNDGTKAGICESKYLLHATIIGEDGLPLKSFSISTEDIEQESEMFLKIKNATLALQNTQTFEAFTDNLSLLPKQFLVEDYKQYAIIQFEVMKIENPIEIENIILNHYLPIKNRIRNNFQFLCGDELDVKYSMFDSNGNAISYDVRDSITLGKTKTKKQKILEYIALHSLDNQFSVTMPRGVMFENDKTNEIITLQGSIVKK